ncbi:MAG TPA: hypothetical protein VFR36_00380 [Sphingomicrobium sp.]|nr:hypothetical protein [Sphingomicrobium sp.]
MYRKPYPRGASSLARDFRLIGRAFAEAFHGMSSSARLESRWSKLRYCGEPF